MLMTTIRLAPPSGTQAIAPGAVVDLIWLHAAPPDGIKHIHARAGPGRIEVVMFVVASQQDIGDYVARAVCRRAVDATPALRGWQIL
jgi:hypothetical protein